MDYWEIMLQQLPEHMVKARLCEPHQDALLQKQFKLKQEQVIMFSIHIA